MKSGTVKIEMDVRVEDDKGRTFAKEVEEAIQKRLPLRMTIGSFQFEAQPREMLLESKWSGGMGGVRQLTVEFWVQPAPPPEILPARADAHAPPEAHQP